MNSEFTNAMQILTFLINKNNKKYAVIIVYKILSSYDVKFPFYFKSKLIKEKTILNKPQISHLHQVVPIHSNTDAQ